ncbi:MAG: Regulatory protein RecX [bacterium ADurb.Bin212]|nr:MAG: Regulatory protein RecX [bacterium ADurb.Bin212]
MDSALNYALKLISKKDYTEVEIKRKLAIRDVEQSKQAEVIDFLKQKRFLDDVRFTENYINMHSSRGDIRIRFELIRKGVEEDVINTALNKIAGEHMVSRAREFSVGWIEKNQNRAKDRFDLKSKLFAKLSRQGFSYDTICQATKELLK